MESIEGRYPDQIMAQMVLRNKIGCVGIAKSCAYMRLY